MEKRVKSRFSHCQLNLIPFAETFDLYVEAARKLLTINDSGRSVSKWNNSVLEFCDDSDALKVLEQSYLISNTISMLKKLLV